MNEPLDLHLSPPNKETHSEQKARHLEMLYNLSLKDREIIGQEWHQAGESLAPLLRHTHESIIQKVIATTNPREPVTIAYFSRDMDPIAAAAPLKQRRGFFATTIVTTRLAIGSEQLNFGMREYIDSRTGRLRKCKPDKFPEYNQEFDEMANRWFSNFCEATPKNAIAVGQELAMALGYHNTSDEEILASLKSANKPITNRNMGSIILIDSFRVGTCVEACKVALERLFPIKVKGLLMYTYNPRIGKLCPDKEGGLSGLESIPRDYDLHNTGNRIVRQQRNDPRDPRPAWSQSFYQGVKNSTNNMLEPSDQRILKPWGEMQHEGDFQPGWETATISLPWWEIDPNFSIGDFKTQIQHDVGF